MNAGCIWMYYECTWLFCCSPGVPLHLQNFGKSDLDRFGMIWILGSLPQNVILRGYVKYERMNQKYQRVGVLWRLPQKNCRYGYVNIQHVHSSIPSIYQYVPSLKSTGSTEFLFAFQKSTSKERLASLFSKKFWRRNEQLLVEGTPAKELHVVAQGDVSIILGGKAPGGVFFWTTGSEFCCTLYIPCYFLKNDSVPSCSHVQIYNDVGHQITSVHVIHGSNKKHRSWIKWAPNPSWASVPCWTAALAKQLPVVPPWQRPRR